MPEIEIPWQAGISLSYIVKFSPESVLCLFPYDVLSQRAGACQDELVGGVSSPLVTLAI